MERLEGKKGALAAHPFPDPPRGAWSVAPLKKRQKT